jgi:hypothetical protein
MEVEYVLSRCGPVVLAQVHAGRAEVVADDRGG